MTETQSDAIQKGSEGNKGELLHKTTPTLRPTLLLLGLSLLFGFVIIGYLITNPTFVAGDEQLTQIVTAASILLLIIIVVRLLIRLFVLSRTNYIIRTDVLRREFSLFLRHWSREVPVRRIRGHEYSQNRIQTILGFGTVRMLTGGTNQSLGFVEFEDVPEPEKVEKYIQELTSQTKEE